MTGTVLEGSDLSVRRMGRAVFRDVDVALAPGCLLQVTGPNGAGKTSLLRVLCSLLQPAAGRLAWRGRTVRGGDPDYLARLAYVGHNNGIDADLSAIENLRFAARLTGQQPEPGALRLALARLGLDAVAGKPVRTLSQGQRRRVSLARLALAPRELWLLDEPLTSLDHDSTARFGQMLDDHLAGGGMAVVATHQLLTVASYVLDLGAHGARRP
ncbi:ABC transporter involved in cytochrome c biogenesis, ATPase component CcmA [Cupriavidus sp. U2]|uniref:cytochrome c biogenesis heme-transporting ATPase CcmA n=1 Tax=Cupriavidus sp. U2 TaxID=2920269 RepID=UPI00129E2C73|nr:cytochrome c biogenesis heme-transporting ATPase CcmA [Cupriavidus sp. U2]KAI3591298.1 ABC transporter involved in cytochrome c biogenesis, ATPase component CcmA [Cupriavidus sp. U2]